MQKISLLVILLSSSALNVHAMLLSEADEQLIAAVKTRPCNSAAVKAALGCRRRSKCYV